MEAPTRLDARDLSGHRPAIRHGPERALAGSPVLNRLTVLDLAGNAVSPAGVVTLMGSPYRHWRTVFEFADNRPAASASGGDEGPIPLECGDE